MEQQGRKRHCGRAIEIFGDAGEVGAASHGKVLPQIGLCSTILVKIVCWEVRNYEFKALLPRGLNFASGMALR